MFDKQEPGGHDVKEEEARISAELRQASLGQLPMGYSTD